MSHMRMQSRACRRPNLQLAARTYEHECPILARGRSDLSSDELSLLRDCMVSALTQGRRSIELRRAATRLAAKASPKEDERGEHGLDKQIRLNMNCVKILAGSPTTFEPNLHETKLRLAQNFKAIFKIMIVLWVAFAFRG